MKITKRQLKRIINEEKRKILRERPEYGAYSPARDGGASNPEAEWKKLEAAIQSAMEALGEGEVLNYLDTYVESY